MYSVSGCRSRQLGARTFKTDGKNRVIKQPVEPYSFIVEAWAAPKFQASDCYFNCVIFDAS